MGCKLLVRSSEYQSGSLLSKILDGGKICHYLLRPLGCCMFMIMCDAAFNVNQLSCCR